MAKSKLLLEWENLIQEQRLCRRCATDCRPSLIHIDAKPLFGRFQPWRHGILFLFEAPNWDDTVDKNKGYLTYDKETDPTGRFARKLMVDDLGLNPSFFQVTNSVLCLPAKGKNGNFPVKAAQQKLCSSMILDQIRILDPTVVVPVGGEALRATRRLCKHPHTKMSKAVARPTPWLGRWLFPLYHTSRLARYGPTGRKDDEQHKDWQELGKFLVSKGIKLPVLPRK